MSLDTLADALKALGINPDNDPIYHAKRWIEGRDADRRDLGRMTTAHGDALARVGARDLRIKDLEAQIASNVAEAAAREMRIADLERDLAAKGESLKTANAALNRICELLCAPAPVCPEDAVTAVCSLISECEIAKDDAAKAEQALKEIAAALDDAGAPKVYHLEDGGERPIPDAERIRLLGERVRGEHAERIREGDCAAVYRERLAAADLALDDRNAPRFADGAPLSVAARIRALPC